jgi:hypothetical protein
MVILDVHIEDMNRSVQLAAFVVEVFKHSIKAPLFASDNHIGDTRLSSLEAFVLGMFQTRLARHPVLEPLWEAFDVQVAAQHVQQAVVSIERGVLRRKLIMYGTVRGTVEVIDIGLVCGRTRQAHQGARAKRDGGQVGRSKLEMSFHGAIRVSGEHNDGCGLDLPVLVTGTHGAKFELELVVRHHVALGVYVVGAVHAHGERLSWRRWRRRRDRRRLLLPRPQSWIAGHGEGTRQMGTWRERKKCLLCTRLDFSYAESSPTVSRRPRRCGSDFDSVWGGRSEFSVYINESSTTIA